MAIRVRCVLFGVPKSADHLADRLLELQALTAGLVEHFAFAPAPGVQIRRAPAQIMIPLIKGKENKGTQMPLLVSIVE